MQDLTIAAVHTAIRGLVERQRVTANNIANVETPGFVAGRVSFEESLRDAVQVGAPQATDVAAVPSTGAFNVNGNNVQLDDETMSLTDSGLHYQLMVEAMNAKFGLLRTAMGRN